VAKAAGTQVIHSDGHDIPTLLKAILQLMPLDKSVGSPVSSSAHEFFLLNASPSALFIASKF
jgi:L-fucose mutarotase/ribose pyranase (RbsD/FucU family)